MHSYMILLFLTSFYMIHINIHNAISDIKRNEIVPFTGIWMDLDTVIQRLF